MPKRPSPPTADASVHKKAKWSPPAATTTPRVEKLHSLTPTHPSRFPTLTPKDAIVLLQGYQGWLRNKPQGAGMMQFHFSKGADGKSSCTLSLPFNSPIGDVWSSQTHANEQAAKRDAAYNAILLLHAAGEIDDNLVPTPKHASNPTPPPGAVKMIHQVTSRILGAPEARQADRRVATSNIASGSQNGSTSVRVDAGSKPSSTNAIQRLATPVGSSEAARVKPVSSGATRKDDESRAGPSKISDSSLAQASNPDRISSYPCKRPAFWDGTPISENAFGAVLTVDFEGPVEQRPECRALLLVTSKPLPFSEAVNLQFEEGGVTVRAVLGPSNPYQMGADYAELDMAFEWTRLCMRAVMSSPLDCRFEDCEWLVMPLFRVNPAAGSEPDRRVCWDDLRLAEGGPLQNLDATRVDKMRLQEAVLQEPEEFGTKYYGSRLRIKLRPDSPYPSDRSRTILEVNTAGGSVPILKSPNQTIVTGHIAYGAKHNDRNITTTSEELFLVPELLKLNMLRSSVFRTAVLLPRILSALDEHLLAAELSSALFGGSLDAKLARSAIRAPQLGADNYGRLAWVGAMVMKLVATVAAFHKATATGDKAVGHGDQDSPTDDLEAAVNQALALPDSVRTEVAPFIRSAKLDLENWAPNKWVYDDGTAVPSPAERTMSDQVLYDVSAALVGAAYLSTGNSVPAAFDAMVSLGFKLPLTSWDVLTPECKGSQASSDCNPFEIDVLDYEFEDIDKGEVIMRLPPDNDLRGQFDHYAALGEPLLEYLTADTLLAAYPDMPVERLADVHTLHVSSPMRSAFLATCEYFGCMEFNDDDTETYLKKKFCPQMESIVAAASKDTAVDLQRPFSCLSFPDNELLATSLQAILGGILHDSGYNIARVRQAYDQFIAPFQRKYGFPGQSSLSESILLEMLAKQPGLLSRADPKVADEPGASWTKAGKLLASA